MVVVVVVKKVSVECWTVFSQDTSVLYRSRDASWHWAIYIDYWRWHRMIYCIIQSLCNIYSVLAVLDFSLIYMSLLALFFYTVLTSKTSITIRSQFCVYMELDSYFYMSRSFNYIWFVYLECYIATLFIFAYFCSVHRKLFGCSIIGYSGFCYAIVNTVWSYCALLASFLSFCLSLPFCHWPKSYSVGGKE